MVRLNSGDISPVQIDPFIALITGLSGSFGFPEPSITSSVTGGSIVGSGSDNDHVDLELDLDKWFTRVAGGPPLGFGIPDLGQGASGSYDLLDVDLEFTISQAQEFTFTPGDVQISLQFPESVTYWVYDGATLVDSGTGSVVDFIAGQRLDLIATENEMDVVPTFTLADNTFGNETETTFATAIGTKALELTLDVDGFTVILSFRWPLHDIHLSDHFHELSDHWHDVVVEGVVVCPGCTLHIHGGWEVHSSTHEHWTDPVVFGGTEIHEGPVYDESHPISSTTDTSLYDKDRAPWELQGFNSPIGASLHLNPQQPPTAVINGPGSINEGATASFDGSDSFDPEGETITYTWNFGDGSSIESGVAVDHTYEDDGTYTVTLTVDDGHGDSMGIDSYDLIVNNLDPTLLLDTTGAVTFPGGDAFLGRIGLEQNHEASTEDPGSDDLTFDWTFLPDVTSPSNVYYNNGSSPDPAFSIGGIFPFSVTEGASVTFAAPGVYTVAVTATDDNGGSATDSLVKLVSGTSSCAQNLGYWQQQLPKGGQGGAPYGGEIDEATWAAYLEVTNFVSGVFSESVSATTIEDVRSLLRGDGGGGQVQSATREALVAWLNFANGGVALGEQITIKSDGSRGKGGESVTQSFQGWMGEVEGILSDPGSTRNELNLAAHITQTINLSDKGNKAC